MRSNGVKTPVDLFLYEGADYRFLATDARSIGPRMPSLRGRFRTKAADDGVALTAVAAVMGHADIHTTMRYAHATDQGRRRAVESVV